MIKKYLKFITERFSLENDFGITYEELQEILYSITDEFQSLEYYVEDSVQSSLIEIDSNCFVVLFATKGIDFPNELPTLYFVEPKIFELIRDVNSHLKAFNLCIVASDFGESDAYYELVISKIGHTPKFRKRWNR